MLEPKALEIRKIVGKIWMHGLTIGFLLVLYIISYEGLYSKLFVGKIIHYLVISVLIVIAIYSPISSKNLLVKIGNGSYGIYLVHVRLLMCILPLFASIGFSLEMTICSGVIIVFMISYGFGIYANQYESFVKQFIYSKIKMKK